MSWPLSDSVMVVNTRFCDCVNLEFYKLQKFWFGLRFCFFPFGMIDCFRNEKFLFFSFFIFFIESEVLFSLLKRFEGLRSG